MTITIKSGSFSPNKDILKDQLNNKDNDSIESKVLNTTISIWGDAKRDLSRLSKIVLDGKTIVDFKAKDVLSASAEDIFDEILLRTDDSKVARAVTALFQQGLILGVQQEIHVKTGITNIETAYSTYAITTKDKVYVLETTEQDIKVIEEILYQKIPTANADEKITFFKVKILVSGTKNDLVKRNYEKLKFEVFNTGESYTELDAKKKQYGSLFSSKSDAKSYISG